MHGYLENGALSLLKDQRVLLLFGQPPSQQAQFIQLTNFKEFIPSALLLV
jgi:hypothetical protein